MDKNYINLTKKVILKTLPKQGNYLDLKNNHHLLIIKLIVWGDKWTKYTLAVNL